MTFRLLALLPLILPVAAEASSEAAWRGFEAKVVRACVSASGLAKARAVRPVGFDDTLGKVVTLVTGTERLARGRTATVSKLCVYDQRSGRTWLAETAGWRATGR